MRVNAYGEYVFFAGVECVSAHMYRTCKTVRLSLSHTHTHKHTHTNKLVPHSHSPYVDIHMCPATLPCHDDCHDDDFVCVCMSVCVVAGLYNSAPQQMMLVFVCVCVYLFNIFLLCVRACMRGCISYSPAPRCMKTALCLGVCVCICLCLCVFACVCVCACVS